MYKNKIGAAFPEFIYLDKSKKRSGESGFKSAFTREYFLLVCLVVIIAAIFLKLFYLQVIKGSYYRYLADSNRIKTVIIHAPRGIILDRNNTPLVFNVPGFRKTVNGKTKILEKDEVVNLMAKGEQGFEMDVLREYPYKESASHVLGYIGQISEEELKNSKFVDYKSGDLIGKMGIENEYEERLRGTNGKQLFEVDSFGKEVRKLGQTDPVSGQNIKLTLDIKLQEATNNAMKDIKRGAVVISNTKGEILALVSKPSFDPNLFTMGSKYNQSSDSASLKEILTDTKYQTMLNRTISGMYPPGSTFKLVVAAAGLEENIIDENYTIEDTGVLKIGDFSFANWYYTSYGGKEGEVDIVKGIKRSNDIFFYKLAEKIGVNNISKWAKKFGLGEALGIDLPGEVGGTVPNPEWKEKTIGEQWYLGDTYHYGIGQGYLLTTPLQVNSLTEAIANDGKFYQPHLLKNKKITENNKRFLSDKTIGLIKQGMIESCSEGGVAWPLFNFKVKNKDLKVDGKNFMEVPISSGSADMREISIACKTGTAQHGGEQTLPHSWITLFAPAYDPQIVVTVLAEETGEGSNVAGPISKKILEEYFKNIKNKL